MCERDTESSPLQLNDRHVRLQHAFEKERREKEVRNGNTKVK